MISIVATYFNRPKEVEASLLSLLRTKVTKDEYELILVDDASHSPADGVVEKYKDKINIKYIKVKPEDKIWFNPCVAYNIGFSYVSGDKIIIQNAECYHVGDILDYVKNCFLKQYEYYVFSNYSVSKDDTIILLEKLKNGETTTKLHTHIQLLATTPKIFDMRGWYQHPIYNNRGYHFCSCIHNKVLKEIGGFDLRYSIGDCWDDNDFLLKCVKKCRCIAINDTVRNMLLVTLHIYHDKGTAIIPYEVNNEELFKNIRYNNPISFSDENLDHFAKIKNVLKNVYNVKDEFLGSI